MKKSLCVLLAAATVFSFAGCGSSSTASVNSSSEEIADAAEYIFFNSDFQSLSDLDAEALLSYLEEMSEGNYQDVYITSEGEVCLALEDGQHTFWLDAVEDKLTEEESELQDISSSYYCDFSDDHTVMNLYYDMCLSFEDAFAFVGDACIYCAMYQIIEGNADWSLYLNVYNKDTGKLVAGGDLNDEVYYDNTQWNESYCLDDNEEADLLNQWNNDSVISYQIDSTILDAISVIDILCTVNGNDYTYLYINDKDEVILGLSEEEKQDCLAASADYLEKIQTQFSDINENYRIVFGDNYAILDFYFDSQLDEQNQTNYFIYTETICMIFQILNQGSYYMEFNIYNSESGELVSTGNSQDGVSWKME